MGGKLCGCCVSSPAVLAPGKKSGVKRPAATPYVYSYYVNPVNPVPVEMPLLEPTYPEPKTEFRFAPHFYAQPMDLSPSSVATVEYQPEADEESERRAMRAYEVKRQTKKAQRSEPFVSYVPTRTVIPPVKIPGPTNHISYREDLTMEEVNRRQVQGDTIDDITLALVSANQDTLAERLARLERMQTNIKKRPRSPVKRPGKDTPTKADEGKPAKTDEVKRPSKPAKADEAKRPSKQPKKPDKAVPKRKKKPAEEKAEDDDAFAERLEQEMLALDIPIDKQSRRHRTPDSEVLADQARLSDSEEALRSYSPAAIDRAESQSDDQSDQVEPATTRYDDDTQADQSSPRALDNVSRSPSPALGDADSAELSDYSDAADRPDPALFE